MEFEKNNVSKEIEDYIIRKWIEKRYTTAMVLGSFIIGFLLGVLAHAL